MWVNDQLMDVDRPLSSLAQVTMRTPCEVVSAQPRRSGESGGAARRRPLSRCVHALARRTIPH